MLISDQGFIDYNLIISIKIPDTVTHINDYAFNNCFALELINFPKDPIHLGDRPFTNCTALKSIEVDAEIQNMILEIARRRLLKQAPIH